MGLSKMILPKMLIFNNRLKQQMMIFKQPPATTRGCNNPRKVVWSPNSDHALGIACPQNRSRAQHNRTIRGRW